MKYQDILPDVLAGKWVRPLNHKVFDYPWLRMKDDGFWEDESNMNHGVEKDCYSLSEWEVKLEEIYVWGVCHKSGKSEIYSKKPYPGSPRDWVSDQPSEWLEFGGKKNLFPTNKPQKYKLILVDEEPGTYRYKYSIQTEEKIDTKQVFEDMMSELLREGEYKMWKKFYQRLGKVSYFPDSNSFLKQIKEIIDDLSPIQ